jgi:hypothetical protein
VDSQNGFDLHFLHGQGYWAFLHVCFRHLDLFLWKSFFSSFAHFFTGPLILGEFSFFQLPVYSSYHPLSDGWQRFFSPFCGKPLQFRNQFLLCRSFLISYSPICQSFLLVAEPFVLYWGNHCLSLLTPVYSLLFPKPASKFLVLY